MAVRGGMKAARNSAIGCACLLAVIEGVGIGFQRMMAENTRLDVRIWRSASTLTFANTAFTVATTTSTSFRQQGYASPGLSLLPIRLERVLPLNSSISSPTVARIVHIWCDTGLGTFLNVFVCIGGNGVLYICVEGYLCQKDNEIRSKYIAVLIFMCSFF